MLKKTIKYTDYNGNEREEDFMFNLDEAELMEMELATTGGLSATIEKIVKEQDTAKIIEMFKNIVLKSYGKVSDDGRRFIKNDEVREAFEQNPAFDQIYIELVTNADYAAEFLTAIMPSDFTEALGSDPKKELLDRMKASMPSGDLTIA